jgi:hypothetical protein
VLGQSIDITFINTVTETIFVELFNNEYLNIINGGTTKQIQMKYSGLDTNPIRYIITNLIKYYLGARFSVGLKIINIIGFGSIYGGSELEFEGGNGSINNPYQINSWNQLNNVRNYFFTLIMKLINKLLSNIDISFKFWSTIVTIKLLYLPGLNLIHFSI